MNQTDAGQAWSIDPGSPVRGGHAYVAQRWDTTTAPMQVVTWGQLQRVEMDWWMAYGDEAWVIITEDWFLANGKSASGVELIPLGDEFAVLTGQPNPFRKPASRPWYCMGLTGKIMPRVESWRHKQ
jgi:hypothetical protein